MREIIGAVDETFLERMILVFMDLATGYLVLEEVADDRTYATWKALVEERLQGLGTGVLYVVSDRAKALIQLAEKGLECLSMPDFFHVIMSSSRAIHWPLVATCAKRTRNSRKPGGPGPLPGAPHAAHDAPEATAWWRERQAEVSRWEEAHTAIGAPGDPLAHTASLPHCGLGAPDLGSG